MSKSTPNMLHLVHGAIGADALRAALGLREIVASIDPLSVGPVPSSTDTRSDWLQRRTSFWAETTGGYVEPAESAPVGPPDLDRCLAAPGVTLWLGVSPADQLFAGWFCRQLLDRTFFPIVKVVQFRSVLKRSGDVMTAPSIGLVSESELRQHPPAENLDHAGLRRFSALWTAWLSPDPSLLADISRRDADDLHQVVASCLLDYYPELQSGLGFWDFALLRNVAEHGPKLTRVIGNTLALALDRCDPIGDAWLFWRVRRLGSVRLRYPLLQLDSDSAHMRDVMVRLTPHGGDVLEGRANAVDLNGVDDHVGGVHLRDPGGRVWFRVPGGITEREFANPR